MARELGGEGEGGVRCCVAGLVREREEGIEEAALNGRDGE